MSHPPELPDRLARNLDDPPREQGPAAWRGPRPDLERLPGVTAALAVRAEEHDRAGSFPADGIAAVHAAGLLTATVAERYGGPGAGLAHTVAILRALGRGDPSVALITAMTLFQHAAQAKEETWPGALYAEALAESARRPVLINALRVEPELGTPARGGLPATTARRVPGGWSLTGRKIFSTGAVGLRWMVVWASTDESPARVGSFLVRSDSPGITIEPTWDHLGLRASRSDDVILAGTTVPAERGHRPGRADGGADARRRADDLERARPHRALPRGGQRGQGLADRLPE